MRDIPFTGVGNSPFLYLHGDLIYLSYIRTLGIPFRADWSGVKVLRYRP